MADADPRDRPASSSPLLPALGAGALVAMGALIVIVAAPLIVGGDDGGGTVATRPGANGSAVSDVASDGGGPGGPASVDSESANGPPSAGSVGSFQVWPLPALGEVPDFTFTERNGDTVTKESLLGKVWVVDFIFTNCGGVCPVMSNAMSRVHAELQAADEAACVSISTDPKRDTLEVLREYADRYDASQDRWLFLRGPVEDVLALSYRGFHIGHETDPFSHSGRAVLVDRDGVIRGYYGLHDPDDAEPLEALLRHVRRLIEDGGR